MANTSKRITAAELEAIVKVMREHQVIDLASGDTRIVMSSNATALIPGQIVDPMKPIKAAGWPLDLNELNEEEEVLLYASSGGLPPDLPR